MNHLDKLCQRRSRNRHGSLYGISIFTVLFYRGNAYARVYLHVFFPVGFLNDETLLSFGSTRTLMKAPLCVET